MSNYIRAEYWRSLSTMDDDCVDNGFLLSDSFWKDKNEALNYQRISAAHRAIKFFSESTTDANADENYKSYGYLLCLLLSYRLKDFEFIKFTYEENSESRFNESVIKYFDKFYYAVSLIHLDDPGSGESILRSLSGRVRPSHQRVIDSLLGTNVSLSVSAKPKIVSVQDYLDHSVLKKALLSCLEFHELSWVRDNNILLEDCMDAVRKLESQELDINSVIIDPPGKKFETVFISGFGYSGSGAVNAYLSQFEAAISPFSKREPVWLQGRRSMKGLFDFLVVDKSCRNFSRFLCGALFGVPSSDNLEDYDYCIEYSLLGSSESYSVSKQKVLQLILNFMKDISLSSSWNLVIRSCLTLFYNWLELFNPDNKVVLLNNVLMAHRIELLPIFSNSRFLFVKRSILDSFVSQKIENSTLGNKLTPSSYAKMMFNNYGRFYNVIDSNPFFNRDNLSVITFEQFVTDPALRLRLKIRYVGQSERMMSSYDPRLSLMNVGIYKDYDNKEEIELLASELMKRDSQGE